MVWQIAITIIGAVISGVIVFVCSQIIVQKFVKPYEDFKILKGKVAFILVMYAHFYCSPIKATEEFPAAYIDSRRQASIETRKIAAEVSAFQERIGRKYLGIPSKKELQEAASKLIGLSNSFFLTPNGEAHIEGERNRECAESIRQVLAIQTDVKNL